uniref:Uncharacterized protein n=1 Tax=Myoviridae sp. ctshb19 TaxID=2825194 RepID=A0A8S5UGG4_9CAUD|nr:MAG TPA: hypothetical protein [Myoviridae sp. ctshb19]
MTIFFAKRKSVCTKKRRPKLRRKKQTGMRCPRKKSSA